MILSLSLLEIINQIEFYTVSINSFLITIARGLYHRFEIVYVSIVEDEKEIGIGSKWTILEEAERVMIRENPLSFQRLHLHPWINLYSETFIDKFIFSLLQHDRIFNQN